MGKGLKKKFFFGIFFFREFFQIENSGERGRALGKQIAALETPLNCASNKAKKDVNFQNSPKISKFSRFNTPSED
jgi:hypothetical protein